MDTHLYWGSKGKKKHGISSKNIKIGRKKGFELLLSKAFVNRMYNQNRKTLFFHINQSWGQGILVFTFRTFPELDCSPVSIISHSHFLLGLFHWSPNKGFLVSVHYHL